MADFRVPKASSIGLRNGEYGNSFRYFVAFLLHLSAVVDQSLVLNVCVCVCVCVCPLLSKRHFKNIQRNGQTFEPSLNRAATQNKKCRRLEK